MGKLSYSELITLPTYAERLEYLRLGDMDRNSPKDISNPFYTSQAWRRLRNEIIIRDLCSDMGVIQFPS